jgi:hypothetical protein
LSVPRTTSTGGLREGPLRTRPNQQRTHHGHGTNRSFSHVELLPRRILVQIYSSKSNPAGFSLIRANGKTRSKKRPGTNPGPRFKAHQQLFSLPARRRAVLSQPRRELRFLLRSQIHAVVDALDRLPVGSLRRFDLVRGVKLHHLIAHLRIAE